MPRTSNHILFTDDTWNDLDANEIFTLNDNVPVIWDSYEFIWVYYAGEGGATLTKHVVICGQKNKEKGRVFTLMALTRGPW